MFCERMTKFVEFTMCFPHELSESVVSARQSTCSHLYGKHDAKNKDAQALHRSDCRTHFRRALAFKIGDGKQIDDNAT